MLFLLFELELFEVAPTETVVDNLGAGFGGIEVVWVVEVGVDEDVSFELTSSRLTDHKACCDLSPLLLLCVLEAGIGGAGPLMEVRAAAKGCVPADEGVCGTLWSPRER